MNSRLVALRQWDWRLYGCADFARRSRLLAWRAIRESGQPAWSCWTPRTIGLPQ